MYSGTRSIQRDRARAFFVTLGCAWGLLGSAMPTEAADEALISVRDAVTQPRQPADHRISYGANFWQFGDLRLPETQGPHPVVVLIHGGCWQARYDLHLMDAMAERLTSLGYATWNLEFRRDGHETGGWPGTLQDVLLGTRHLVNLATSFDLDLGNTVVVGHSSGGHLALWLAAQVPLTQNNPVLATTPLQLRGVVALAPAVDLYEIYSNPEIGCHDAVASFMGATPSEDPARYQFASPAQMERISVPQITIAGGRDAIITVAHVDGFVRAARARGDSIRDIIIDSSGHFEMVTPGTEEWAIVEDAIISLMTTDLRNNQ
jgi:acetyl esterase/lipase